MTNNTAFIKLTSILPSYMTNFIENHCSQLFLYLRLKCTLNADDVGHDLTKFAIRIGLTRNREYLTKNSEYHILGYTTTLIDHKTAGDGEPSPL